MTTRTDIHRILARMSMDLEIVRRAIDGLDAKPQAIRVEEGKDMGLLWTSLDGVCHLVSGGNMHGNRLLWTLCEKHDIPANAAYQPKITDKVTCWDCKRFSREVPAPGQDPQYPATETKAALPGGKEQAPPLQRDPVLEAAREAVKMAYQAKESELKAAIQAEQEPQATTSQGNANPYGGEPAILFCPSCKTQHIDEGEWAYRPHRTHQCQNPKCGHKWKAAHIWTVGVGIIGDRADVFDALVAITQLDLLHDLILRIRDFDEDDSEDDPGEIAKQALDIVDALRSQRKGGE